MTTRDHAAASRFAAIADCIIPRTAEMPSASDVGIGDLLQRKLTRYRPDLVGSVGAILGRATTESPEQFVERLEIEEPQAFQLLFQAVAGSYYLSPEVRQRIGYPGQEAQLLPREGIGVEDLLEGMLDAPKIFRRCGEDI
jgi:hypothetical protein